ncbi:CAP-Gly domain-containing linker protein 4 [Tupaia chinensis]|uniref:CAP-Gly domain-containing linker protein 4 n=1 Tax=Tupaia chinensis TaxID=246437 RepID=L8YBS9_TUPCH|nr:CAP-Gly domain-containing linker protein 4 [Tupaia chinensis]
MPSDCEFSFFDPNDASCQEILFDPKTSVSELFAILRQWVPQVQQNIDIIGNEILKRGCNVNDRDGLTDMTLLHYTCKSGAHGIDVDATCSDFNFGTALHIAAYNLCAGAIKCLLEHGANPAFRNDKGQIPADVVPDPVDMPLEMADAAATAKEIKQMLLDAVPLSCNITKAMLSNYDHVTGKAMLTSLGLKLGDRVVIAGQKVGTLRFCGTTEFASGQWAGIELDEPEGKNNGSVGKVQYFKCAPKYGIFAPLSKISKAKDRRKNLVHTPSAKAVPLIRSHKIDVAHVTSKVNTGTLRGSISSSSSTSSLEHKQSHPKKLNVSSNNKKTMSKSPSLSSRASAGIYGFFNQAFLVVFILVCLSRTALRRSWSSAATAAGVEGSVKLHEGSQVLLTSSNEMGTVRYVGPTDFASGIWLGLELRSAKGKNDGSVGDKRYFTCKPNHGVLVRPSRVTYRGINGSKLVDENC